MAPSTYQHDWATDTRTPHVFPPIPGGISKDVVEILKILKEYDDACLEARVQMFIQINELLGNSKSEE